jgi:predicted AAA+ superfamily ATPase
VAGLGRRTVIDEVQRAPQLLLAIKSRLDRDNATGQFLLTGSANLRRIPTVADALPGRVDYVTLWPFTQGEMEGRPESFLPRLFAGEVPQIADAPIGRRAYERKILAGGFPEAQRRSRSTRVGFFSSYVASIVEREVVDTSNVRDPSSIATLLRLVAARSGSLARYETLGADVGIDGKTVKAYLDVLERLFLVRVRQPWYPNLGKRQVKAPKLYVVDSGLLGALIGVDERRLQGDDGMAGSLFETFVATELERHASWLLQPPTFWHYREEQREVDVIAEQPSGEVVGIEVRASASIKGGDFAGLSHLRRRIGDRLAAGVVLYTGERTLPFGEGLWVVPLEALWRGA